VFGRKEEERAVAEAVGIVRIAKVVLPKEEKR
jgi:hypothetical protein